MCIKQTLFLFWCAGDDEAMSLVELDPSVHDLITWGQRGLTCHFRLNRFN